EPSCSLTDAPTAPAIAAFAAEHGIPHLPVVPIDRPAGAGPLTDALPDPDRPLPVPELDDIAYLKWDHNRDLLDAGHGADGVPGVHGQTLAVYRLIDELKARHPRVEIESCSSVGARVDLEILERTDRVWAS
ncbi:alpha-galactosidase, partial [Streptomyces sp. SID12488]|uniref:alpha-galactosidase n=1 Tax=Streptomyces sp. SID12488 TaxID=2706040 RepID=UPI0013FB4139